MGVPSNTLQTYQSSNNAEDVSDIINNVSPFDTPFSTMAKKTTAEATYTEWLIESLEAIDTANANIEGDDATTDASTTPTRVGNYTQLLDKTWQISTTQQAIKKYGVSDEWSRQTVKKGKALKSDFEAIMIGTNHLEKSKAFYDAVLGALGVPALRGGVRHAARRGAAAERSRCRCCCRCCCCCAACCCCCAACCACAAAAAAAAGC